MLNNIFSVFLKIYKIPHTLDYSKKMYNDMPYSNSMYGLGYLFNQYQISNECVKFNNKKRIINWDTLKSPLIIILKKSFVIIAKITNEEASIIDTFGNETKISIENLLVDWDGYALILRPTLNSSEPNLPAHKNDRNKAKAKRLLSIMGVCAILMLALSHIRLSNRIECYIFLFINCIGLFVTLMLLQKELNISSKLIDRICSIIPGSNCNLSVNNIIPYGIFSFSELGCSYFMTNLIVIIVNYNYLATIGVFSLLSIPFCIWSVLYQKFKLKNWCFLCLLIVSILLLQSMFFVISGSLINYKISYLSFFYIGFIYFSFSCVINYIMAFLKKNRTNINWKEQFLKLKYSDIFIDAFHRQLSTCDINEDNCSCMIFGNLSSSRTFTIVSNPFCNPCADMHKRIDKSFLKDACIRYVFTYFSEELSIINKYFIAAYLKLGSYETWKLLGAWYNGGIEKGINFFTPYDLDTNSNEVSDEFTKQKVWRTNNSIKGTPTVFFNNHRVEYPFKMEDYLFIITK